MHTAPRRIGSALLVPLLLLSTLGSGDASTASPDSGRVPARGASGGWDVRPADLPDGGTPSGGALPRAAMRIAPVPSLPLPDGGPEVDPRPIGAAAPGFACAGARDPGCESPPAETLLLARRAVHARLLLARSGLLSSPATAPPGAGPLPLD